MKRVFILLSFLILSIDCFSQYYRRTYNVSSDYYRHKATIALNNHNGIKTTFNTKNIIPLSFETIGEINECIELKTFIKIVCTNKIYKIINTQGQTFIVIWFNGICYSYSIGIKYEDLPLFIQFLEDVYTQFTILYDSYNEYVNKEIVLTNLKYQDKFNEYPLFCSGKISQTKYKTLCFQFGYTKYNLPGAFNKPKELKRLINKLKNINKN